MNEELKIIISAEIDKLKKELKEAQGNVKEFADKGESSLSKFGKGAAKAVGVGMAAVAAAVAAGAAALVGVAEATREFRQQQAMLTSAFEVAGGSAEDAKKTYNDLYRVLGDSGQATEAAQHLAKLTTEEKALSEWTNICQGVYATFGSSLPLESLTEAVNHSAKLGEVQGSLADALEWSGISVDEFNEQLFWCNTEAEREKLIRDTLNGLYADSAAAYEVNNAAILSHNEAQAKLTESLAAIGEAIEPIIAIFKGEFATILAELTPSIELFAQGLQDAVSGVEGGAEKMREGLTGALDTILTKITELIPVVAAMIPEIIAILGELIPKITKGILDNLPLIINTILQAAAQIITVLGEILPEILIQIVAILPQIIDSIIDNIPVLLEAAINFLLAIVEAIPEIIPPLVEALPQIVDNIIDVLMNSIPILIDGSIALLNAIVMAIPEIIPSIVKSLPKIVTSVTNGLIKLQPQLSKGVLQVFAAIPSALINVIPKLVSGAKEIIGSLKTNLVNKLQGLFKFEWSLPKLKVPKFSITPSGWGIGDLLEGVIPKLAVTWNARGGVFDKPALFGYGNSLQGLGENGAEAVVPLENNLEWLNKLADMLSNRMGAGTPIVLTVDGKVFAQTAISTINQNTRQNGKLALNIM